jgi:hypothetical protein
MDCRHSSLPLTLRILRLALTHCEIVVGENFGALEPTGEHDRAYHEMLSRSSQVFLLYPTINSIPIEHLPFDLAAHNQAESKLCDPSSAELCECGRPSGHPFRSLVVIDGSWRHAKAIGLIALMSCHSSPVRRNPHLGTGKTLTVRLSERRPCVFADLMPEPDETFLSTAEAVGSRCLLSVSLIDLQPML